MKPFDLEAFKRGEVALMKCGKRVSFVAHAPSAREDQRLISVDERGIIWVSNEDGSHPRSSNCDLTHMAPKKVQIWGRAFRTNATSRVGVATDRQFDRLMEDLPPYAKWIEPEPFLIGEYDE